MPKTPMRRRPTRAMYKALILHGYTHPYFVSHGCSASRPGGRDRIHRALMPYVQTAQKMGHQTAKDAQYRPHLQRREDVRCKSSMASWRGNSRPSSRPTMVASTAIVAGRQRQRTTPRVLRAIPAIRAVVERS